MVVSTPVTPRSHHGVSDDGGSVLMGRTRSGSNVGVGSAPLSPRTPVSELSLAVNK